MGDDGESSRTRSVREKGSPTASPFAEAPVKFTPEPKAEFTVGLIGARR